MTPEDRYNQRLVDWVRQQYGPGRKYRSARQWSIAAGRNVNAVNTLEEVGHATPEVVVDLARAAGVSPIHVLIISGLLHDGEAETKISDDALEVVAGWDQLPQQGRHWMLGSLRGMLQIANGQGESRRVVEEGPGYQAGPGSQ